MRIEEIHIENFKKISEIRIPIGSVNYLVGGNNAGKSSVLQAVHMAVSCAKLSAERGEAVIPESELRYSPTSEFILLGHTTPYENKKDGSRGRVEFIGHTSDDAVASYRIEIYKGRNYGNIGVERTGVYPNFGQNIVDPKTLFSVYVPGISGIPHREEYKSYASVFQKAAAGDANLVFRNVIRLLQERNLLKQVEQLMIDLAGQFNIRLNHKPDSDTYLNVEMSLNGGQYFPLDLIGTGILQILQIISYVALFKPTFLLVDEPDNHLHPSRQALLSRTFDNMARDYGATVIVSTHSRHLVASASSDAKIIWMKDGKVESDNCRDLATVMMDLGALDQLDSRGAEVIICTEDRGKKCLEDIISTLNMSESVKVISYNGISNAGAAIAIRAMCDLLPSRPKVIVHRDRDFLTDDEIRMWGKEYDSRDMRVFAPPLCDIESYYCLPQHIAKVYNVDVERVELFVRVVLAENLELFRRKFRDKRRDAIKKFWLDGGGPATDDLWPEDSDIAVEQVYGKELMKKLNERLARELDGRRNLQGHVSAELATLLKKELQALGLNFASEPLTAAPPQPTPSGENRFPALLDRS